MKSCWITKHETINPIQRLCENKNLITARSPACFILRVVRSALIIKTMTNIEQIIIDALKLQWESDWIISATKNDKINAISFSIHTDTTYVDCGNVEISEITLDGTWLRLSGWYRL